MDLTEYHQHLAAAWDGHAATFDAMVAVRDYQGPAIAAALLEVFGTDFDGILDIGCGSGLSGRPLRRLTRTLHGIDLSAGMLAEATKTGLYDRLWQGAVPDALTEIAGPYDAALSLGLMPFLPDVAPLFVELRRLLRPGAPAVLSADAHDGPEPIRPSPGWSAMRTFSADYLAQLVGVAGLELVSRQTITDRLAYQDRAPVPAHLLVVRAPL